MGDWDDDEVKDFKKEAKKVEKLRSQSDSESSQGQKKLSDEKFDFSEDEGRVKEVYTIWGEKGSGKTTAALYFPGKICAISFDRKTAQTVMNMFEVRKDDIHVWDGLRYFDDSKNKVLNSAAKSLEYIQELMDKVIAEHNPDWIIFDGVEIYVRIAEFVMRKSHGLKPFGGVPMNAWKERNSYVNGLHNKALSIAKRGVIYTTYVRVQEKKRDGQILDSYEIPKWAADIKFQTDYTVKVYSEKDKDKNRKFLAEITNSKNDSRLQTGKVYDITNKGLPLEFDNG